jgi:hypothetical protein
MDGTYCVMLTTAGSQSDFLVLPFFSTALTVY